MRRFGSLLTATPLFQADSQMGKDRQVFYDASLQYVFKIQEVQERKKFEFVEPVRKEGHTVIRSVTPTSCFGALAFPVLIFLAL